VGSTTWESHLQQLDLLFRTLAENNLSVNPRKTELALHEVEYLGFKISADGLRMSKKGTEAIEKITVPKNAKALQRILGLFNFYRSFIDNYAKKTAHMRALLKADTAFIWSVECDNELNYLKSCLTNKPVLRPLDPRKPLVLACDGSTSGFGWVYMQQDEQGNLHFGANATTVAQQKYPAHALEAVALMLALKSMEVVALHKEIIVMTDNSHLFHLNTWQAINARQKRTLAYLMQFRLQVRYIKGKDNLQADCLSRLFQESTKEQRRDFIPTYGLEQDDFILAVTTTAKSQARMDEEETQETTPPQSLQ